jgi:hypothetical protein
MHLTYILKLHVIIDPLQTRICKKKKYFEILFAYNKFQFEITRLENIFNLYLAKFLGNA